MEYQVPQFIEVESRIVGPLTIRQFIYVAGGAGLCAIFLYFLPLVFGIILSLPVAGFAAALAFYRINGKPFIDVLESGFNYYTGAKLFLWKHEDKVVSTTRAPVDTTPAPPLSKATPKLTRGKLSELAWSLDVKTREEERAQS